MYKRILVAIDGSNTSDLALREAMRLAKDQHAALRLVHVVDITPAYTAVDEPYPFAEYERALQEEGEKLLANRAATVREAGVASEFKIDHHQTAWRAYL